MKHLILSSLALLLLIALPVLASDPADPPDPGVTIVDSYDETLLLHYNENVVKHMDLPAPSSPNAVVENGGVSIMAFPAGTTGGSIALGKVYFAQTHENWHDSPSNSLLWLGGYAVGTSPAFDLRWMYNPGVTNVYHTLSVDLNLNP